MHITPEFRAQVEARPEIYTKEAFAAYCESRGEERFQFTKAHECAAAQYLRSKGEPRFSLWSDELRMVGWCDALFKSTDERSTGTFRRVAEILRAEMANV